MEKYFITKGTDKKGPYSIDDLLKMELTDEYLIWKDGFEQWKPITEISELKSKIIISPPPTPAQVKQTSQRLALVSSLKTSGIWLLILWAAAFLFAGGYKSDDELENNYGHGEYAIYGGGSVIRQSLIWTTLIISFVISLVILLFVYREKIAKKNVADERDVDKDTDGQIITEEK